MKKAEKYIMIIARAGAVFAGFCVVAMMFLVTFDVIGRTVFTNPIKGSYAITQNILMPCSFFTALPMCYLAGILPKIDGPLHNAKETVKKINMFIVMMLEAIMFAVMTYGGYRYAKTGFIDKLGVDMDGKVVRVYPMYIIIPIGFLITLICVFIVNLKKDSDNNTETDN